MTKDEALDKALNALLWANIEINDWRYDGYGYKPEDQPQIMEAITAIKEALAQPEQEPVAFINVEQRKLEWAKYMSWDTPTVVNLPKIPLYTTPPQRTWVGLTEVELDAIYAGNEGTRTRRQIYQAIEAKLKEKNT